MSDNIIIFKITDQLKYHIPTRTDFSKHYKEYEKGQILKAFYGVANNKTKAAKI